MALAICRLRVSLSMSRLDYVCLCCLCLSQSEHLDASLSHANPAQPVLHLCHEETPTPRTPTFDGVEWCSRKLLGKKPIAALRSETVSTRPHARDVTQRLVSLKGSDWVRRNHPSHGSVLMVLRGTKGVPKKGVGTSVKTRVWACKELKVKRDQPICFLRPPLLGTPISSL